MRSPLADGPLLFLDETASTQAVAREWLTGQHEGPVPGVILANHQVQGRGRFDRVWFSEPGDSLTVSFVLRAYANHPKPWLVGMAIALAATQAVHARIQWPNDVVFSRKKLGGVLSEMISSPDGLVPVVGVGINLNQSAFPAEISDTATSMYLEHGRRLAPIDVVEQILERIELLPEPNEWSALHPIWSIFDETPGKRYRMASGEEATAIAVGPEGQLLCAVDGESTTVFAADAIFGPGGIASS